MGGVTSQNARGDGHGRASTPAPPDKRGTIRWVVGVAFVLVLGVGAVLAVLALGADDGNEQPAEGGLGEGEYVPVESLCRDIDFSPVFDIAGISSAGPSSRESETASSHMKNCIFGGANSDPGLLEANALIGSTPEDASRFYQGFLEQAVGPRALPAHAAGRWDDGVVLGSTHPTTEVGLIVLDDVLVLKFRLATPATGITSSELADLQSALLEVAEHTREVMRRRG